MPGIDDVPLWMLSSAEYMQPGEAAQALGVSLAELLAMVNGGQLVDHRMDSGHRRYSRAEVAIVYEVLAAEREREASA